MPQVMEKIIVPMCEVKVSSDNRGLFEGYGSTFGNADLGDDVVVEGAFDETLKDWKSRGQLPAMFWMHSMSDPIGEYMDMRPDAKGLYVKGQLWVKGSGIDREPIQRAEQARNLYVSNGPKGLSIGYIPTKVSFGKQDDREVRFLEKVDLLEISPVPFGMNPEALVFGAKSLISDGKVADIRTFERALRDAGLSLNQAKAFLAEGYKGLRDVDPKTKEELSLHTELTRLKTILKGE